MINLTIPQAVDVWTELDEAYFGRNRYASDTAEIYAFRLLPYVGGGLDFNAEPGTFQYEKTIEAGMCAAENLYELLKLYTEKREVIIYVNDRKLGKWVSKEPFLHRNSVRVKKKNKNLKTLAPNK